MAFLGGMLGGLVVVIGVVVFVIVTGGRKQPMAHSGGTLPDEEAVQRVVKHMVDQGRLDAGIAKANRRNQQRRGA